MKQARPETLDVVETRESHRFGIASLALVAGGLAVAMALAVSSASRGIDSGMADCQRVAGANPAAAPAKRDALLLCSTESGFLRKLF